MAIVIFFRAVNVGGHQTFQPSRLAKALASYDVVSIGAAGTFVAKGRATELQLRKAIAKALTFTPEFMMVDGVEIQSLFKTKGLERADAGIGKFLTVMSRPLTTKPRLPICAPDADDWQVRIVAVKGVCALSLRRTGGKRQLYPNEIIEKTFKVSATTRNWATLEKICDVLAG